MKLLTHELGRRRVRVAALSSAVMLALPLLGLARSPHTVRADAQSVSAGLARADLAARLATVDRANRGQPRSDVSTTTTDGSPSTTLATAAAVRAAIVTTRRVTTTKHVAPPSTRPAPRAVPPPTSPPTTAAPSHQLSGSASWYDAPTGTCAMRAAPRGTVVRVTNIANGRTTTCRVADYGPAVASRVVDLSKGSFAAIADPAQGVIQVRVTW